MTEEEEFEFRHRFEQEQIAPQNIGQWMVKQKQDLIEQFLRQLALGGKAAASGLTSLATIPAEALAYPLNKATGIVNSIFGTEIPISKPAKTVKDMLDKAYGVEPESATERVVGDVISSLGGVSTTLAGGQALAKTADPVVRKIGEFLAANPIAQSVSSTGASTSSSIAREKGATPLGQIGAGIVGGMTPLVVGNVSARTGAKIADLVTGKIPSIRAAKTLKDVAGEKIDTIERGLQEFPDVPAAKAALSAQSTKWSALGKRAEKFKSEYFKPLTDAEKENHRELLRGIAGGNTQEEAKQARDVFKDTLNAIEMPKREIILENANIAGKKLLGLQKQIASFGDVAANKVEDVRRLTKAESIAEETAKRFIPVAGQPRIAGKYSYADELAKRAGNEAQISADESLIFGDRSRLAQYQADSLEAHGLSSLTSEKIISGINSLLKDPKIGPSSINTRVLNLAKKKFADWTDEHGVIDAYAVETIRKSAVNDAIEQFMGSSDPKTKARRAAEILGNIKPSIDKAIESAGGTGWKEYLEAYSSGMKKLNQQKLGAKALDLYEKNPDQFLDLASGNSPKIVQDIMGTEYNITSALGKKNQVLQKIASDLKRNKRIEDLAEAGTTELAETLKKDAAKMQIPGWLNRSVTATRAAIDVAEDVLNKKTMKKIYDAMETGKSAYEALNVLPEKERNYTIKAIIDAGLIQPFLAGGMLGQAIREDKYNDN